jgi:hypothetical protein
MVLTMIRQSDSSKEEDGILARWRRKSSHRGGPPSANEPVTYLAGRRVAVDRELGRGKMVARLWAVRRGGGEYQREVTEFLPRIFPGVRGLLPSLPRTLKGSNEHETRLHR